MSSAPLRRPPLTSLTADAVLDLIRERGLKEGDPIPAAAEMAVSLGVSRTVIREAIAELAGQGLVQRQQGAQSVVRVPGSAELERMLRLRFTVRGDELIHVHELRESVEVAAARLATRNATEAHLDALRDRLADLRAAPDNDARHRADLAFHRAVVEASGNELMQIVIDAVSPLLDELMGQVWEGWTRSGREPGELVEAHRVILDAIAAGDESEAGRAMEANLAQGRLAVDSVS